LLVFALLLLGALLVLDRLGASGLEGLLQLGCSHGAREQALLKLGGVLLELAGSRAGVLGTPLGVLELVVQRAELLLVLGLLALGPFVSRLGFCSRLLKTRTKLAGRGARCLYLLLQLGSSLARVLGALLRLHKLVLKLA
jgi:hypothetical protein